MACRLGTKVPEASLPHALHGLRLPYLSRTGLLHRKKPGILRTYKNWDSLSACENYMDRNGHSRRAIRSFCFVPSSSQTEVEPYICNPGAGEVEAGASHESKASQSSRDLSRKKPIDLLFYLCSYDICNTIQRVHYSIYVVMIYVIP